MRYVLDTKDKCVRVYDDKGNEFICVDKAFLEVIEDEYLDSIVSKAQIMMEAEVQ